MPAIPRLTDKFIRSVSTDKPQEEFWDSSRPGLYLRVMGGGTKSFFFSYYSPADRRKRSLPLGRFNPEGPGATLTLADAVTAWKAATAKVAEGIDPQGPLRSTSTTEAGIVPLAAGAPAEWVPWLREIFGDRHLLTGSFGELARDYLVDHAWPTKRRTRDDEQMLKRELLPAWRDLPAAAIGRRDVIQLTGLIVKLRNAPVAAEHVRLLVSRVYNFGLADGRLEVNPAYMVRVRGGKAKPGRRWLSDEEIKALWRGLEMSGTVFAARVRVELLLMQRPGEVAAMEWRELQPDSWWIIPGEKLVKRGGEQVEVGTKNKLPHAVFLPPLFWEVIEPCRPVAEGGRFVFPSPRVAGQPLWNANKVLTALARKLGVPHFTPQDLRRTGTTNLQRLGYDHLVDPIVNHVQRGVRRHYNLWQFREEKKAAMLAWEAHLRSLLGL